MCRQLKALKICRTLHDAISTVRRATVPLNICLSAFGGTLVACCHLPSRSLCHSLWWMFLIILVSSRTDYLKVFIWAVTVKLTKNSNLRTKHWLSLRISWASLGHMKLILQPAVPFWPLSAARGIRVGSNMEECLCGICYCHSSASIGTEQSPKRNS